MSNLDNMLCSACALTEMCSFKRLELNLLLNTYLLLQK